MNVAGTSDGAGDRPGFTPGPSHERITASVERFGARIRRRRAVLAIIAGFALLAAACVIAGFLAWRDIQAAEALANARQVQRDSTLALESLLTAETTQRGYLLMRDLELLANYDDAKARLFASLSNLMRRSPYDSSRRDQLAAVARAATNKFAELDQTIALGQAGQFDAALLIVRAGTGKSLMIDFRRAIDGLMDQANVEIAQTTITQSRLSTLLVGAILTALVCVAGLAVLLLRDARRHFGLLESREISVRQVAETLERRVARRTRELAEANQRFDAALRASGVTVMTQDRDLVFTWISQGVFDRTAAEIIGGTQEDVTPDPARGAVTNLKRGVIETGEPARADIRVAWDGVESWFDLTANPLMDEAGTITGVIAAAVDITRYKEQDARTDPPVQEFVDRHSGNHAPDRGQQHIDHGFSNTVLGAAAIARRIA